MITICSEALYLFLMLFTLLYFFFRWPNKHDQWWECKFLMEGIIDQGGGFRDSLSDIAEELCPSSSDAPVPLPFFIRSPNQVSWMWEKELMSLALIHC